VGVKPAVAAGVGLLNTKLLHCGIERSHLKEMSAVHASPYPAPPASPPASPLMSEKPALFPEESEAARIAVVNPSPALAPPPCSPKREPEREGEIV